MKNNRTRILSQCQKGMILVEILTAVVILSVGLIGVYRPIMASFSALEHARIIDLAGRTIQEKAWALEMQLKGKTVAGVSEESQRISLGTRKADYQWKIKPVSSDNYLIETTHKISWKSAGRVKSYSQVLYLWVMRGGV